MFAGYGVPRSLTRGTNFRIRSARRAEVSRWTHAVGAEPLPRLTVRHGVRGPKLAEIPRAAVEVGGHQTRGIACVARRTQGAVSTVGKPGDGVVRPEVAIVSLDQNSIVDKERGRSVSHKGKDSYRMVEDFGGSGSLVGRKICPSRARVETWQARAILAVNRTKIDRKESMLDCTTR